MEHVHSDAGTRITGKRVTQNVPNVISHFVNEMVFVLLDVHFRFLLVQNVINPVPKVVMGVKQNVINSLSVYTAVNQIIGAQLANHATRIAQHHQALTQNVWCLTASVVSDVQPENMDTLVPRHAQDNAKMSSATRLRESASINAIKDTMVITVTIRAVVIVLATTVTVATVPVWLKTVWSPNTPGMVRPVT